MIRCCRLLDEACWSMHVSLVSRIGVSGDLRPSTRLRDSSFLRSEAFCESLTSVRHD